jgi:hypothetical protein
MVGWLLDGILTWLAERIQGALSWLVGFLTSAFFTTPDVTVFPQAQALAERSALIVQATFGLAIITAGAIGMTYGSVQIRYELKDLLPRLVFAFVASAFGTQLCSGLIQVANALTAAMVGQVADGPQVIEFVKEQIKAALLDEGTAVVAVIIALLIVVLIYQVMFAWFMRVAVLLIVAGTAPIALACYALPQTQPVAQLWWRTLLTALAVPVLQGVTFAAGIDMLLDPDHARPLLLELETSNVVNLLMVACLLTVTMRIPRLLARYASNGRSMSTAGVVVRAVVLQSAGRRLPGTHRVLR